MRGKGSHKGTDRTNMSMEHPSMGQERPWCRLEAPTKHQPRVSRATHRHIHLELADVVSDWQALPA